MIPGMYKSNDKPTPVVNTPLAKNEGAKTRKYDFNYKSVIGPLNFIINSTRPKDKFVVPECVQFSADPKLLHNQAIKRVLQYLNVMATKGLILKPDPEKGTECYVDAKFSGGYN